MSKRNSPAAKARRRAERVTRQHRPADRTSTALDLVDVQSLDQLADAACHGERLPCGCDAHDLMRDMLGTSATALR